jgi:hypothetical protein
MRVNSCSAAVAQPPSANSRIPKAKTRMVSSIWRQEGRLALETVGVFEALHPALNFLVPADRHLRRRVGTLWATPC